jgi:hypothetical protein
MAEPTDPYPKPRPPWVVLANQSANDAPNGRGGDTGEPSDDHLVDANS